MMMKRFLILLLGGMFKRFETILLSYKSLTYNKMIGGGDRVLQAPFHISGVENIIAGNHINIGEGALIMSLRAKLIIKSHFVAGPSLTIITGDHMPIVGKYIDEVSDNDKDQLDVIQQYDQDVTIEEDVWCGANVTILKGVTVGRGAVIASGAIVTRSIPPYTIAGGIPAKVIKNKWSLNQVIEHEQLLYEEKDRKTGEELNHLV